MIRPRLAWADLPGRRVAVWGLGTEGRASLRRLRAMGVEPVIVDDAPDRITDEVALPTTGDGLAALLAADVVIKTPGISRRRPEVAALDQAGIPVTGGLGLWLESVDPTTVLCITGTKGKSTTTSIAAHLARLTVASALSPPLVERRDLLGPEVRWVTDTDWPPAWAEPLGLLGHHNYVNACVARACLESVGVPGADDTAAVTAAAHGFTPLEGRLERVATVAGVDFIDDGLSTNVLPTLAALDAFAGRRVALIAGGFDRHIDYTPLAEGLATRAVDTLVLTTYTTGPAIQAAIEARPGPHVVARPCADLDEAVRVGFEWARPDGVVLLSPAAASFDAFADYKAKGRAFRAAVATLPTPAGPAGPPPASR